MTYEEFLQIEEKITDSIVIKKVYIDMVGDYIAGVLLSQIIYWNLPSKKNKEKRSGEWLIKRRSDWYSEIRITPNQYDRAIAKLKQKELVEVEIHKSSFYNCTTVPHIKFNYEKFMLLYNDFITSHGETGINEISKLEELKDKSRINETLNPEYIKNESGINKSLKLDESKDESRINETLILNISNNKSGINKTLKPESAKTETGIHKSLIPSITKITSKTTSEITTEITSKITTENTAEIFSKREPDGSNFPKNDSFKNLPEEQEMKQGEVIPTLEQIWSVTYKNQASIYQRLYDSFLYGYSDVYSDEKIMIDEGKYIGVMKTLAEKIHKYYPGYSEQLRVCFSKLSCLGTIAKRRNKYQDWKFNPMELLKHWDELVEGCIIDERKKKTFDYEAELARYKQMWEDIKSPKTPEDLLVSRLFNNIQRISIYNTAGGIK